MYFRKPALRRKDTIWHHINHHVQKTILIYCLKYRTVGRGAVVLVKEIALLKYWTYCLVEALFLKLLNIFQPSLKL